MTVTARLTEALTEAVRIPVTARFGNGPAAAREIPIAAGATSGTLDIATPYDDDSANETLIVAIDTRRLVAVDPQVRREVSSVDRPTNVVITVRDIPALSSGRATAREGQDEAAVFTVRLSYEPVRPVTVNFATADAAGRVAGGVAGDGGRGLHRELGDADLHGGPDGEGR